MQPAELFQKAEAQARALDAPKASVDAAVEKLRTQCVSFFDQIPEPPVYRRSDDPARKVAAGLLPRGQELLAQCLALEASGPARDQLAPLTAALKEHLAALCHVEDGRIDAAEPAWVHACELERVATSARRLWMRSDEALPPVFDKAKGSSRFDPRPEPLLKVKLACVTQSCRHIDDYEFSPRHATHHFVCPRCREPFTAYIGEVRGVEITEPSRGTRHYVFRIEELSGAFSRVEFEDRSGAELSVARRDMIAFLYTHRNDLRGVLNLSSSRLLWIQPGGICFLATVAYGEGAPELDDFRRFRDQVLRHRAWGRAFVRAYYRFGGPLARAVGSSAVATRAVRAMLCAVHGAIR